MHDAEMMIFIERSVSVQLRIMQLARVSIRTRKVNERVCVLVQSSSQVARQVGGGLAPLRDRWRSNIDSPVWVVPLAWYIHTGTKGRTRGSSNKVLACQ